MSELYVRRRDLVCDALQEIGVDVKPPRSTIYVWAPVPEGFDELGGLLRARARAGRGGALAGRRSTARRARAGSGSR